MKLEKTPNLYTRSVLSSSPISATELKRYRIDYLKSSETPLILLAKDNFGDIDYSDYVETLIELGVDVNQQDEYGNTALFYASGPPFRPDFMKTLLENGADIGIKNYENLNVMEYLENIGDVDSILFLKQNM